MLPDKQLLESVEYSFAHHPQLSAFNIQAEILNGLVILRGAVPTSRAKLAAHELAASAPGCGEVINDLEVRPALGATDEAIADAVRHALEQHSEIAKGAIAVQVNGGLVMLSGAVGSQKEYVLAEDAARSTRGVREVSNLLIIDRDAQDEDEKLRNEILSAIDSVPALFDTDISVAVSGDLIILAGHVQHYRQKELAGEIAYNIRPWRLRNEITVSEAPSMYE